jgi:hypothetical protein
VYQSGVNVPKPLKSSYSAILMNYIGDQHQIANQLKDEDLFEKRKDGKEYLTEAGRTEGKKIYEKYSDKDIRNLARVSKNSLLNWISEKAISRAGMSAIKSLFIRNLQIDEEIPMIKEDFSRFTTEQLLDELISRGYMFPFYTQNRTNDEKISTSNRSDDTTSVWQDKNRNDIFKKLKINS